MTKNLHPLQELTNDFKCNSTLSHILGMNTDNFTCNFKGKERFRQTLYVVILKAVLVQKESNMGTADKSRIF